MPQTSFTPEPVPREESLAAVVSNPSFAQDALALIHGIAETREQNDVLELFHSSRAALGADQAIFVSFVRDDESRESIRFLLAASARWCLEYEQMAWFGDDAWLMHAITDPNPICDSAISYRTNVQRNIRELARKFGVESAYIVPAPTSGGVSRIGALILTSQRAGFFECPTSRHLKPIARALSMELHEWWTRRIREDIIVDHRIDDTDLELLRLEKRGLKTKQIAAETHTSEASVNSRFQRLNAKFGQHNRKASARFATEYGLIP